METVLRSFSLGFLLRSVFAGAFFVLTYSVATKNTSAEVHVNAGNLFSFGMVFALIAGVTVYGIHRAVIYPWFEWSLDAGWAKRSRQCGLTLINDNVIRELVNKWDRKAKKDNEHAKMRCRTEQITLWADYIHLQYDSAWCIVTGYWVGEIVGQPYHMPYWRLFTAAACFSRCATGRTTNSL